MAPETPALRYYRPLVGSWAGRFRIEVCDATALARASAWTRVVGFAARWSATARMRTTLEEVAEGVFRHTTRVTKGGVPVLTSEEDITVGADGAQFVIAGEQRMLWAREPYRAEGRVDPDAEGARYPISWLGAPMEQRTRIEGRGLRLTQRTA